MTGAPERLRAFGPRFVFQWHVTDRCHLACAHCYRTDRPRDLVDADLSAVYARMRGFLERQGLPGQVHFAGGEPLGHPLLPELARRAHDDGMITRILTSATRVDDGGAKRLVEAGAATSRSASRGRSPSTTPSGARGRSPGPSTGLGASRRRGSRSPWR